jgi:LuxR family transcriptional regulator, maltose regulon positive regulatory protein
MARNTPKLRAGILTWYENKDGQEYQHSLMLEGAGAWEQWQAWLQDHGSFSFRNNGGTFTARKETRQKGGEYWIAYRKIDNKLYKRYLGTAERLTLDHLRNIARELQKEV